MNNNEIASTGTIPKAIAATQNVTAITPDAVLFYAQRATTIKTEIDKLGAEVSQRQDKMRHINDLIADINNLTDAKHCLDINQHTEIQEKLRVAEQLGVKIVAGKLQYSSIERDRLIQNVELCGDNWNNQNKHQTQKMDILIKALDRVMMLLKDIQKKEDQAIHGIARAGR